jgi:hypothetical protein
MKYLAAIALAFTITSSMAHADDCESMAAKIGKSVEIAANQRTPAFIRMRVTFRDTDGI